VHARLCTSARAQLLCCPPTLLRRSAYAPLALRSRSSHAQPTLLPSPPAVADGLAHSLGELSAAVDPDEALLALANATGAHFLLRGAADGGLPHAFRPAAFVGKSKDQPAYVLARLPSSSSSSPGGGGGGGADGGEPTHAAVLDRPTAEALRRARADQDGSWAVLRHPGTRPRDKKRAREQAIDVTVD